MIFETRSDTFFLATSFDNALWGKCQRQIILLWCSEFATSWKECKFTVQILEWIIGLNILHNEIYAILCMVENH